MSKGAPGENRERRRAEIVQASLELLEEGGIDKLSLRGVAQKLGMHPPGMYWYISSKQELIDLLATAILADAMGDVPASGADETWDEWLTALAIGTRKALLAHRDGARVVAGARLFRTDTVKPAFEKALELLERAGFTADSAWVISVTVITYAMGVALDDQASPQFPKGGKGPPPDSTWVDPERWPRLAAASERHLRRAFANPAAAADLRFRRGLALIIAGARSG
ncbi:MAG: TetR/AcrR family transcriptional regulator C-terminal domain-containing protein [Gemmatimonadota bacterium]